MPGNMVIPPNQNQALIEAGNAVQSTHHEAAQASAARFIEMLREAYPASDMHERAEDVSKPSELIARIADEQKKLHHILEQQIALLDSAEAEAQESIPEELLTDVQSPIYATLRMMELIKGSTTQSRQDIKHVLMQMCDIAKTCPGFIWSENDRHWSINAIFDAAIDRVQFVIASPAETLNLVCRAILDEERYPHQTLDGKSAIENQLLRIDSLFRCLRELYRLKHELQREKCTGGVQHDLLNLLSFNYHNKPCSHPNAKPIEWINDTTAFVYEKLTNYVADQLTQFSEESVIIDWIKFQEAPLSDDADETHPLISFLRKTYPSEEGEPDTAWKSNCKHYLSQQCVVIGLNPYMCNLDDKINAISSLEPPALEGGLTPMMLQLMRAKPIQTPSPSALILKRNQAILYFQTSLEKSRWDFIKKSIPDLFTTEEIFQILFQNCQLNVFVGPTTDLVTLKFKNATMELERALFNFYDQNTCDRSLLTKIKSKYFREVEAYKAHAHVDYVEYYFDHINPLHYNPGADHLLRECTMVDDETLEQWNRMQATRQGCYDLTNISVYEVNRLLLSALNVPSSFWSPLFCRVLLKLARGLTSNESGMNSKIQALKNSIPTPLLENFVLVACVQQSDDDSMKRMVSYRADNEAITTILTSGLIATLDKTQVEPIFKFLIERKAEIFISYSQLVYCLQLNLSQDCQVRLINANSNCVLGSSLGVLRLFQLPVAQLCHQARERILHFNRERLGEIIPPIFRKLFALSIEQFSVSERKMLFNPDPRDSRFIAYNFSAIIPMNYQLCLLFRLSIDQLSALQRKAILNALGQRISYYFNDYRDIFDLFSLNMEALSAENRHAIFQMIQPRFAGMMSIDGLVSLLSLSFDQLTPLQRVKIWDAIPEDELADHIIDGENLVEFLKLKRPFSSEKARDDFFSRLAIHIPGIIQRDSQFMNLFNLSLDEFSEPSRDVVFKALKGNFIQLFFRQPQTGSPKCVADQLCLILELPESKLNQDHRAFICSVCIEDKIKNTVSEILELKSKIDPYSPSDSNNEEKLKFIAEEVKLCRQLRNFFAGNLIVRLLKLSDRQLTNGARESLVQLFFSLLNEYVFYTRSIIDFLESELTEKQRRTLVLYAIEKKSKLLSCHDSLLQFLRLPVEKLSEPLRQDLISQSNLSWSIAGKNIENLTKLFDLSFECLSAEGRYYILSRVFAETPGLMHRSSISDRLKEYLRKFLYCSELSPTQRIIYWNKIRPFSGDDFPDIPGREPVLVRAIESQHYQAALDAVFKGATLKESKVMSDSGEFVDGLAYLQGMIRLDAKIADSLPQELELFTNNLLLAEKLTSIKQSLGYDHDQSKYIRTRRFFMQNTPLSKHLLKRIFELQHAMIEDPLQRHPEVLTFVQDYSDKQVEFFLMRPDNNDFGGLTFTKHPYNAQILSLILSQLEESQNSQMALEIARSVGSQLISSLLKIRCLGGRIFESVCPENIVITESGDVLIHSDLLLKRDCKSASKSDELLLSRVARIIYTIACQTTWDTTSPLNLSSENIEHDPLRRMLAKMMSSRASLYYCIFDDFFSPVCNFTSRLELYKTIKLLDTQKNDSADLASTLSLSQSDAMSLLPTLNKDAVTNLVVMGQLNQTEWYAIKAILSSGVMLVTITSKEKLEHLKLNSSDHVILKTLKLDPSDADSSHQLRRAVTIMERSHHPNMIRMYAATRQGDWVNVLFVECDLGSLRHVCSTYSQATGNNYIELLLAVTCQVLNGLVYMHHMLHFNHQDITSDHILLTREGLVKLSGFNSRGQSKNMHLSDMQQLSKMLLELLPPIPKPVHANWGLEPNIRAARDFAEYLARPKITPYEALQHSAMAMYYKEEGIDDEVNEMVKLKKELKIQGIEGSTLIEEMESWRKYDAEDPTREARFSIRGKMKELCLRRTISSVSVVKNLVQHSPSLIERLTQIPHESEHHKPTASVQPF